MNCNICSSELSQDRIEALIFLGTPEKEWKCLDCSNLTTRKVKSIVPGIIISGAYLSDNVSPQSGIQKEPDDFKYGYLETDEEEND